MIPLITQMIYENCFKTKVWYRYSRNYDAPLRPFYLHQVNPATIDYIPKNKIGTKFECSIRGGDWDTKLRNFTENTAYIGFKQRFKQGMMWEKTERYKSAVNKLDSKGDWKGCSSKEEIIEYLKKYDRYYDTIKKRGYMKQREIQSETAFSQNSHNLMYRSPVFEEVTIDVGRDGKLIWYSGIHRLSMARVIGLNKIPVRIRIRHKKWQKKRDEVWTNRDGDEFPHPDLI